MSSGKILHEMRELDDSKAIDEGQFESLKSGVNWWKPGVPYFLSADSTPLFIEAFVKHHMKTGDENALAELMPNLEAAVGWILNYGIKDGLLKYDKPHNGEGLQSQTWKDGVGNLMDSITGPVAVVEVQGYTYYALRLLAPIMAKGGKGQLARRMISVSNALKKRFNEEFWSDEDRFYYLAIDGNGQKIMRKTSNPGQLLYTGIIDRAHADIVVEKLFEPDMLTQYGIRTHSALEQDFDEFAYQLGSVWPHDNWMIARGLNAMGYGKEHNALRDATLKMYEDLKCCPEYVPISGDGSLIALNDSRLIAPPCIPQAWTVGAVINFMTNR